MPKSRWESDEEEPERKRDRPEKKHKKEKQKKQNPPADTQSASRTIASIARSWIKPALRSAPTLRSCRTIDCYQRLNHIEEGNYGVVFRARDRESGDIVAVKRFKLDKENNGFPITSLREINTLMMVRHPNIVNVREIVVSSTNPDSLRLSKDIYMVMDFVEHDLKTLMQDMTEPFLQSEVKTLMIQLLSAVAHMHDNWIIHRDLKTSNLLLNNRGEIKLADFGLARTYGSPIGDMTHYVVTLWYRAPELLLGTKEYSTAIDMWSIGCIFAEFINKEPLLPGRTEIDQVSSIFKLLGMPDETTWPGFYKLPHARNFAIKEKHSSLRSQFPYLTNAGMDLLNKLLTPDPAKRISAKDALEHPYFSESPLPKDPALFPTWPSKGSGEKKRILSPSAPHGAHAGMGKDMDEGLAGTLFAGQTKARATGFRLNLG